MEIALQLWGGLFYLLAKIFLVQAAGTENSNWRMWGWIIYLLGIPPWAIVLASNHSWIAMSVEIGGAPAIILGITASTKKLQKMPKLIDRSIRTFIITLIAISIIYSIYDFHGITNISQVLELGVTVGFLMGTYLLAKSNGKGWLYFLLMNISMGTLMALQDNWIFFALQLISIYFVVYGFKKSKRLLV
jgi:hypothetical protein